MPKSYANHIRLRITEQIEALILELEEREYDLQDKMITFVREEMHEFGMKLIGAILSGMGRNDGSAMMLSGTNADSLPEKSEELPYGALEFLE